MLRFHVAIASVALLSAWPAFAQRAFKDCDVCPEMVVIPAGSYLMGGTRKISIARPLAVGRTEVTFAQWDACVAEGGCSHRPDDGGFGRGGQPVMNITWDDTRPYLAWLSRKTGKTYRLLTDAEWEYAARGGTTTAYYWGDSDNDICLYASVELSLPGCDTGQPSLAGQRRPNPFGLYDMIGSMSEWVEDCYERSIDGVPADGSARVSAGCALRVQRGGSWVAGRSRSEDRSGFEPSAKYGRFQSNGFRVARSD